jgi:hypothetical protein
MSASLLANIIKFTNDCFFKEKFNEVRHIDQLLANYPNYEDISEKERVYLSLIIYSELTSTRKTTVTAILEDGSHSDCNNLVGLYKLLVCYGSGFTDLCYMDKQNYLLAIYEKLKNFRDIKCIENNFLTKESQAYRNMIPRYMLNFAEYMKSDPLCYKRIYSSELCVKEAIEGVTSFVEEKRCAVDRKKTGDCPACGGNLYEWYDLNSCDKCEMTVLPS